MTKGVKLRLLDGVTPLSNLSNLICLWWDQTDVYEFDAPIGRTNVATTDTDGYLKLDLSSVSGVAVGDKGFLVVYKEETDYNYKKAPVFVSIIEVKNYEGGIPLFYPIEEYVRSTDWISLGTLPTETDNKFLGLHAVFKDAPNWCAFKFTCSDSSQYTVDWGDGTSIENINSGTTVYHSFNYTNLAGNTETGISEARAVTFQDTGDTVTLSNHGFNNGIEISFSSISTTIGISTYTRYYVVNISGNTFQVSDTKGGTAKILTNNGTGAVYLPGYRQSLVTVTPTTTGKSFTELDLNIKHTLVGSTTESTTQWLDIYLAAPNMTNLKIRNSTNNVTHGFLERFISISLGNITDFSYMFYFCTSLKYVSLAHNSLSTNFSYMFKECMALESVLVIDTSLGTNFSNMFNLCPSLKSVPLFDTSSGTDFSNMFAYCYSLESIPLLDTSSGINFGGMFYFCTSLKLVPLLDTSSGTNFSSMFESSNNLKSIPEFDFSKGTNFNYTFKNCYSILTVSQLSLISATTLIYMFEYCASLVEAPIIDISNATNIQGMFRNCVQLQSVFLQNTSKVTNFSSMFDSCVSLKLIPFLDTSSGTNFSSMFNSCVALQIVPFLDVSKATSLGIFNSNLYTLQKGILKDATTSISYANCNLSSDVLNEIFNYLEIPKTNPCSITVTTNWGSAKVSLSGTTTSGSTTVTMADTTGLSANMWITGTNISSSRSISFQDTGDTITLENHGIPNGTKVSFTAITFTTGIETNKIYYVVNTQTNTFQVSDTVGGTAKELINDGLGTLIYENYIVSVVPNTSITISIPASGSATNTLTSTTMNPYLATLKGWTVVN
jgi:hypothetical protein